MRQLYDRLRKSWRKNIALEVLPLVPVRNMGRLRLKKARCHQRQIAARIIAGHHRHTGHHRLLRRNRGSAVFYRLPDKAAAIGFNPARAANK